MKLSDLVFTGFNKRVAALHRRTGEIVWQWKAPHGNSYVTLLLDRDVLIVSVSGYTYGLEALSGTQLWYNAMEGFGVGVASLASASGSAQYVNAAAAATAAATAAAGAGSSS
jgi:outer membrane protein assembly factor BamB